MSDRMTRLSAGLFLRVVSDFIMKSRSRSDRRVITVRQSQKHAFDHAADDWMYDPAVDRRHVEHMLRARQ